MSDPQQQQQQEFFTVSFNTDALGSILRAVNTRIDEVQERARLYEERSLQMLDALTETSQRLSVSENQNAALFDTVSTLQKAVNAMQKEKMDEETHVKEFAQVNEQLGQIRVHLDMVDARRQEIDVPALMKRVSQESRDCATKIILERETEQRRATESLLHERITRLTDDVKSRTEHVVADVNVQSQENKKVVEEATAALAKRLDEHDIKAQSVQGALEAFASKFLLTEHNVDALSEVAREDVGETRQLVACVAHAFGVNLDALLSAVPSVERSQLTSEACSESSTVRSWKWDSLEMLRKQAVVDGWAPLRNISSGDIVRRISVPTTCPAAPDSNTALAKRDEMVRLAAKKRKEITAERGAQQQIKQQQQQQSSTSGSDSSFVSIPESGKLFLASPIFVDVETRAVASLRSDMSVLKQKVISDATTQIQQMDRVVRQKISFDQAKSLVVEASGVASEQACEPIKEQVESLKKQVLMRDAALALLQEKVSHSELRNEITPALEEAQQAVRLSFEMQLESSVLTQRTALEKNAATVRERCATIEENVEKSARTIALLESELRAVQLRAAASVARGGEGGDGGRCLSCGSELETAQQQQSQHPQQQQQQSGKNEKKRPQTAAAGRTPQQRSLDPSSTSASASAVHQTVAEGPSVRVLASSIDDTSDRKYHGDKSATGEGKSTGVPPTSSAASSSSTAAGCGETTDEDDGTTMGNNNGAAARPRKRPLEPVPPAPGTAAYLKQQQQLAGGPSSSSSPSAAAAASNWMQQMDDAFQLRSLNQQQQQSSSSSPADAGHHSVSTTAGASSAGSTTSGGGGRPLSARHRPAGAWNSMSKK